MLIEQTLKNIKAFINKNPNEFDAYRTISTHFVCWAKRTRKSRSNITCGCAK